MKIKKSVSHLLRRLANMLLAAADALDGTTASARDAERYLQEVERVVAQVRVTEPDAPMTAPPITWMTPAAPVVVHVGALDLAAKAAIHQARDLTHPRLETRQQGLGRYRFLRAKSALRDQFPDVKDRDLKLALENAYQELH